MILTGIPTKRDLHLRHGTVQEGKGDIGDEQHGGAGRGNLETRDHHLKGQVGEDLQGVRAEGELRGGEQGERAHQSRQQQPVAVGEQIDHECVTILELRHRRDGLVELRIERRGLSEPHLVVNQVAAEADGVEQQGDNQAHQQADQHFAQQRADHRPQRGRRPLHQRPLDNRQQDQREDAGEADLGLRRDFFVAEDRGGDEQGRHPREDLQEGPSEAAEKATRLGMAPTPASPPLPHQSRERGQ